MKLQKFSILFFVFLFSLLFLGGCQNFAQPISQTGFFFNTVITLTVYEGKDSKTLEGAFDLCEKYENMLSRTVEGSDIYRLNHSNGEPVTVSEETAFLLGENDRTENFADSQSRGTHVFVAKVLSYDGAKGFAAVEMRNRFRAGDELEVLSPSDSFNKIIRIGKMEDESGNAIEDVKKVQQKVYIRTEVPLAAGDILRRKA